LTFTQLNHLCAVGGCDSNRTIARTTVHDDHFERAVRQLLVSEQPQAAVEVGLLVADADNHAGVGRHGRAQC
jgi:hypothetical protein